MTTVLETSGKVEAADLLRLDKPLKLKNKGAIVYVKVAVEDEAEKAGPDIQYPPGYHAKTPAQRAASFLEWVESHKDGPGLSDWAVSRDSMYD